MDLAESILELVRPEIERIVEERLREHERSIWMNTEQAARYISMNPIALAARARRGTVPAHKDGSRWLFRRDELDGLFDTASARGC